MADAPGTCHLVGCPEKGQHPPHGIGAGSWEDYTDGHCLGFPKVTAGEVLVHITCSFGEQHWNAAPRVSLTPTDMARLVDAHRAECPNRSQPMKARHVLTRTFLGHTVQVGFQIRATGVADWPWNSRWHWKVAQFVEDHAPVQQCWSDLVSWALGPDTVGMTLRERLAALLPWRPLPQSCRDSAAENGRCYCGKVGRADIVAQPNGPLSSVIVPDPCAGGCTHDHDHAAGGWRPLCSNCPGCWPNVSSAR